jgi:phage/plasmid-like protein (TIGR03299 family)
MAHELATTNNRPAMMYTGEVPWHRLGTRLDEPATAGEAIEAAGLDFEVELTRLVTVDDIPVPDKLAVVREDSHEILGVVGSSYRPVQNRECFGFLDAVVTDGSLRYHTAGALGKGERIWMLAKLPDDIRVKNSDDITEKYLLLSNSHDGSSSLRVYFTPIRVVCANTLAIAAKNGRGQGVSIVHKGNLTSKVRQAQEVLGLAKMFYDDAEEQINRLAWHYPSLRQLEEYFRQVYPDSPDGESTRTKNVRQEMLRLFEEGIGHDMPDIRHTTWTALNAVTEYVDHYRSTRGKTSTERASNRLDSAWFGSGARIKERAWNLALKMAT